MTMMNHVKKSVLIGSLVSAASVLMTAPIASAFAPSQSRTNLLGTGAIFPGASSHARIMNNAPDNSIGVLNNLRPPGSSSSIKPGTSTSLNVAQWVQDADLFVGIFTGFCGTSPYVLQIFFPKIVNNVFFLPQYEDSIRGREAEIAWKTRFAALAFVITAWNFWDHNFAQVGEDTALRHSYIAWAVFYTDATYNVRKQAKAEVFINDRFGVQAFHLICATLFWASASESYTGHAITNFIRSLLGLEPVPF
jgi:hypothetical protein